MAKKGMKDRSSVCADGSLALSVVGSLLTCTLAGRALSTCTLYRVRMALASIIQATLRFYTQALKHVHANIPCMFLTCAHKRFSAGPVGKLRAAGISTFAA